MGRGKGGGGSSRFRGFFGFGGLQSDTNYLLRQVAIARGLRSVDELLAVLGKERHEVSKRDAFDLLNECGRGVAMDAGMSLYYKAGKGYENCNLLLKHYIKSVKEKDSRMEAVRHRWLTKYCGYTKDELRLHKRQC